MDKLVFSDIKMPGDEIEQIHLLISCAHVHDVKNIPDDWNVQIVRAVSGVETFHAEEGHGVSSVPNLSAFNDVLVLSYVDRTCFKISGWVDTREEHKIKLRPKDFRLIRQ